MGEYGIGINYSDRALSPVDFNQLSNSQSLFSPDPLPPRSTMQDETLLLEKPAAVKPQQLSPGSDSQTNSSIEENLLRKVKQEHHQNGTQEEKKGETDHDTVSSVITSLNQLGLSEPNSITSNSMPSPNFWSTATAEDNFVPGLQAVNGGVPFQSFPPAPNPIFNASLPTQISLNQHQRRAITGNQQVGGGGQRQQNIFINSTKAYPTWSNAPPQSTWSPQAQAHTPNPNPWGNHMSGGGQRSVGMHSLSPGQVNGMGSKKVHNHNSGHVNPAMMISPSKFRRSTSFPGQVQAPGMGSKVPQEFHGVEDQRDSNGMLALKQVKFDILESQVWTGTGCYYAPTLY